MWTIASHSLQWFIYLRNNPNLAIPNHFSFILFVTIVHILTIVHFDVAVSFQQSVLWGTSLLLTTRAAQWPKFSFKLLRVLLSVHMKCILHDGNFLCVSNHEHETRGKGFNQLKCRFCQTKAPLRHRGTTMRCSCLSVYMWVRVAWKQLYIMPRN